MKKTKSVVGMIFNVRQKNEGITLIALIITIIIMLILVAVTVNYSIKSGLLSKAREGSSGYTYKEEEDKIGEIRLVYKVDSETEKTDGKTLKDYLSKELSGEAEVELSGENVIVKYKESKNEHQVKNEGAEKNKGMTLNPNVGDYINEELLTLCGSTYGDSFISGYVIYTNGSDKLKINFGNADTMNRLQRIDVVYYQGNTLVQSYSYKNWKNSIEYFNYDGTSTSWGCCGYPHIPSECWSICTGDVCSCEYESGSPIYSALEKSNYPIFQGEWVLDENGSDEDLIPFLKDVLIKSE